VRPYCFPSYRKSEAEAGSIAPTPIAKLLKQIALALRNPTALVLGLDQQSTVFGAGAQDHAATWRGVLEGVVQQVHHGRRQELRVGVDRQSGVNSIDRELNVSVLGVQHPGRSDLVDERDDRQASTSLFAGFEADFGQRAVDDVAKVRQTLSENSASAAVDGDGASLECVERENRGVQRVSKFVSGVAQTLNLFGRPCLRGQARRVP